MARLHREITLGRLFKGLPPELAKRVVFVTRTVVRDGKMLVVYRANRTTLDALAEHFGVGEVSFEGEDALKPWELPGDWWKQ